ncbi:MAG: hypothetical protein COA95_07265 [Methylophaga sp.]|nr:MAG: hypothetical protein COA95_07265 [Methylophaga sp.]
MIWLIVGLGFFAFIIGWYYTRKPTPSAADNAAVEAVETLSSKKDDADVFVQRVPILNNQQKIIGYQLSPERIGKVVQQGDAEYFHLLIAMISHYDFSELGDGKKIYVKVSAEVLESEEISLFPARGTVLIISADTNQTGLLDSCKRLKQLGYQFALLSKGGVEINHELLNIADFVIIDDRDKAENIETWIHAIRGKQLRIIVSNIQSQDQHERIKEFGVNGYQGFYFSEPETLSNTEIGTQIKHIMHLFNLVNSKAEPEEIEKAFKLDPSLSFNILRYINSAGFGFRNEVSSIKSALVFLGYEKLARWLGVLLALSDDIDHEAQDALFVLATRRARLMELLGEKSFSDEERDGLFMTGMFSLLTTLLGMPMDKIVANLHLPEDVLNALLHQKGPCQKVLALAIACEQSTLEAITPLAEELGLSPMDVNNKQLESIQWSNSLKAI